MVSYKLQDLKSTKKELRNFGLLVGAVLVSISFLRFRESGFFLYPISVGVILIILGAVLPQALKSVYRAWMGLAFVMGRIMTTILLTILFLTAFLFLGMILRMLKKELIDTKLSKNKKSYWTKREVKKIDLLQYEKQY